MDTHPCVSIIMPAYNACLTIAESIQSVLCQSYKNWELIVIDDGSKDNTVSIVEGFRKNEERIVLLILERNAGLPSARNAGLEIAKGDFIAFLDSDDLWHKNKIEKQIDFHLKNPHIEISHTDFHSVKDENIIRSPFRDFVHWKKYKQGNLYPHICYKNPIGVLTVMARKSLIKEVNGFDASLWGLEDQDLWIRIAMKKKEFGYLSEPLAMYRISETGMVRNLGKYKSAYKKLLNKTLKHPNLDANMGWRYYYRYFGTAYFKKNQMKLARYYFWRSLKLVPFDFISASTLVYLLYGEMKNKFSIKYK